MLTSHRCVSVTVYAVQLVPISAGQFCINLFFIENKGQFLISLHTIFLLFEASDVAPLVAIRKNAGLTLYQSSLHILLYTVRKCTLPALKSAAGLRDHSGRPRTGILICRSFCAEVEPFDR